MVPSNVRGILILAQASMSHLESELAEETAATVLSSPELAIQRIAALTTES